MFGNQHLSFWYLHENSVKEFKGEIKNLELDREGAIITIEFKTHYSICNKFRIHFKDFDSKLAKLLIEHSKPKERLLIIKFF